MAVSPRLIATVRWLLALAAPAAALGVTLALWPLVDQMPSPLFVAAVLTVAWLGGRGPALLATAVSAVAIAQAFLRGAPAEPFDARDGLSLLVFVAISASTAWVVAGRARGQRRLALREQQLRLVTDAAPQLIYYIDGERRYRFANRPYVERYGLTTDSIVGRHVAEVLEPGRYASIEPRLAEALSGHRTTFEFTRLDADGLRHLHATYIPDVGRGGVTRGLVGVITDITDRKQAEDERARLLALEQTRRREAEAVAELGRILTEGLDLDAVARRIAELSRALLRATITIVYRVGPESHDAVCLAVSGDGGLFRPGAVLARGAGVVGLAVARGEPVMSLDVLTDPELCVPPTLRAGLERASFRSILAAPLRVTGRIVGAVAVGDRVGRVFTSDEVRLVEALADHAAVALDNARLYRDAEDRRREAELLAELARAITSSLDLDTVLGRVTAAAKELCGADLARIALWDAARAGMTFRYTVGTRAGDYDDVLLTPGKGMAGHVLATGRPTRTESALDDPRLHPDYGGMIRAEGSVAVLVAPIRMGDRIEGLLYVDNRSPRPFTDRDETVLMRLADHAAIALRNARLFAGAQAARCEAESANQAKDEFLAVLSHELRTPLTAMLGWLRLLRSGQLAPDKVNQAVEVIERNTRIQAQLINDLLDVSRIITGKLQLDLFPLDLRPIMEEAIEAARRDAEPKGVRIDLTVGAGAGPVLGDPLRLGQIIGNLLANAVKFTSSGGLVKVSLAREDGAAVIIVADTGVGIEAAVLGHVFDRFRQADSTITRRHGGLGLGLAIVRHLTELHGGVVKAESPGPGRGATFTVRLPLASVGRPWPEDGPAPPPIAVSGRSALTGVRVLLVEDHSDTAELLRALLGGQGADVLVATSLTEALAALSESEFDVLVTDIGMPDGDGYELVQRLRERERVSGRPPLPAVAVTAFAGVEDRERALAAGFCDYAAKPIEPGVLIDIVARAHCRR